jgi:hypothetical protein
VGEDEVNALGHIVRFPVSLQLAYMPSPESDMVPNNMEIVFTLHVLRRVGRPPDIWYECETCRFHHFEWTTSTVPLDDREWQALGWNMLTFDFPVFQAMWQEMGSHVDAHVRFGKMWDWEKALVRER